MSLLSLRGLTLDLDGRRLLEGVDLDLAPGERLGLVGASGSGKSLTALAALGLAPDRARVTGSVRLEGREILGLPDRALCALRGGRIGMVFQEPMTALNPTMRIGAQVAETVRLHRHASRAEAARIARDRLARVGIADPDRYPHALSGGQRQRVAIAMAIACRPALLIADEPTTALDVTTQAEVLDLLRGLCTDEGMGLVLITHDLGVVAGLTGRVSVMEAGRIVETGPTAQIFARPQAAITRRLIAVQRPRVAPARPRGAPLLQVRGAVRLYPQPRAGLVGPRPHLRALDGVELTLHAGESLGLVGPSGCGKSTLTRALVGLEPLDAGQVTLDGAPVGPEMAPALRARMQMVFQDPYGSFNPRHRVARLLAEPFHLTGRPADWRDRVARALTEVGLTPADADRYIHQFSGGQRQRLAIARALITRPQLIVLDEAVSALDVEVRAQVLDLLARLRDSHGLAYLFISHDLSVVRALVSRVAVMEAGRIVEDGPTEAVFANPRHPLTRRLIAAIPEIPGQDIPPPA
ncbi:dipeptide ABC transporter ATP-binding protein [Phaeovulum vinaykumarii]|uniref:Peptide/nickel transport system ATP-binding protein n=1 Tax=Phaeovulum vinaykumarii TaxID=407234 RepID=A0A1N7MM77_9RHOB|nr:ABC transporter ATP-binding protein [Phaeovulum vinaykumarii]SIS87256.1 peptide/nickel transport system ATP-binding protein [Phaeovulum vinaykumarii]SOC13229.1 peptide/nickel transport system ATP-binding protein [Phaeovulum vinaykumarii]